jgi:hypothetical protein
MIMEYEQTNRDRRLEAKRRRMGMAGRGLLTVARPERPVRITKRRLRAAKEALRAGRAA